MFRDKNIGVDWTHWLYVVAASVLSQYPLHEVTRYALSTFHMIQLDRIISYPLGLTTMFLRNSNYWKYLLLKDTWCSLYVLLFFKQKEIRKKVSPSLVPPLFNCTEWWLNLSQQIIHGNLSSVLNYSMLKFNYFFPSA